MDGFAFWVTTPSLAPGGSPTEELYFAAEPDLHAAMALVASKVGEGVEIGKAGDLTASTIAMFKLSRGEAIPVPWFPKPRK